MKVKAVFESWKLLSVEKVSLGLVDKRGREIGANVSRMEMEFVAVSEGENGDNESGLRPGRLPGVRIQPSRDGQNFGASQEHNFFNSIEERDAYIAKRLKAMHASYSKKIAKGRV